MAKALIFSDLHVHAHKDSVQRLDHCLETLTWVFEQAELNNVDHVFFLGDLFHERAKIDVMNYHRTFDKFMYHMIDRKPNFDLWLLIGNHDMYLRERWDVNSIKPLTAIHNVNIVDTPSSISFGKLTVDFCPHTENPLKELENLKIGRSKKDLKLLFGHMSVHGAELNKMFGTRSDVIVEYDHDMVPVTVDIFDDWDQVFLGHYHGAQKLSDSVEYVGSPLQLSFGEAFQDKHVIILDLETKEKTYIKNTFSPQHLIMELSHVDAYDMNNAFVRVEVDAMGKKEQVDLQRSLTSKFNMLSFTYKQKDRKEEDKVQIQEAKAVIQNEDEMLAQHVKNTGVPPGLDNQHLMEVGKACLKKSA